MDVFYTLVYMFIAASIPVAIGTMLIAWTRRREGDSPYCSLCGQNVTGVTSGKCPECGGELTSERVVVGRLRFRRGPLWVGILFIFLGGMFALSVPIALNGMRLAAQEVAKRGTTGSAQAQGSSAAMQRQNGDN